MIVGLFPALCRIQPIMPTVVAALSALDNHSLMNRAAIAEDAQQRLLVP